MKTESSTLNRILDAAAEVFVEVGFAGARVDEIAKRANVNKATIYYHIGGKETLYARILQHVFENVVTDMAEKIAGCKTPEEKLRTYIRHLSAMIQSSPHLPVLMMREIILGSPHMPETILEEIGYLLEILTGILREGVQQNDFEPCSPLLVHFTIIGTNIFSKISTTLVGKHQSAFVTEAKAAYRESLPENLVKDIETLVLRAVKK